MEKLTKKELFTGLIILIIISIIMTIWISNLYAKIYFLNDNIDDYKQANIKLRFARDKCKFGIDTGIVIMYVCDGVIFYRTLSNENDLAVIPQHCNYLGIEKDKEEE